MFLHYARLVFLIVSLPFLVNCQAEYIPNNSRTVTVQLIELFKDPSVDVRRTAALALGKIGHPLGSETLIKGLQDPDHQVREFSAWGIGQIGEDTNRNATIALVAALKDPYLSVKQAAAQALGRISPQQEMMELLVKTLNVGKIEMRQAAVETFMHVEINDAYPVLQAALNDQDAGVRQRAIAALGELGDPNTLKDLRKHLLQDPHAGVRSEAAFRLGKLGDKNDLPVLQKAVNRDSATAVVLWATWAMANIGSAQAPHSP